MGATLETQMRRETRVYEPGFKNACNVLCASCLCDINDVESMVTSKFKYALTTKLVHTFVRERNATDDESARAAITKEVERLVHEYLVFMWIIKANPEQRVSPSKPIDIVWHQHILFTREYADFCGKHFGKFLHHSPTVPDYSTTTYSDNMSWYAKVLIRYVYHTKAAPPAEFWPQSQAEKERVKFWQNAAVVKNSRLVFCTAEKTSQFADAVVTLDDEQGFGECGCTDCCSDGG